MYRYRETNACIDTKVRWPPLLKEAQMAYIPLHILLHLVPCMHIEVRWTPTVLTHEVTNTKFEMKYPDRLLLTSSGQEWQFHIATDIHCSRMAISDFY